MISASRAIILKTLRQVLPHVEDLQIKVLCEDLYKHYDKPEQAYHDIEHITYCLNQAENYFSDSSCNLLPFGQQALLLSILYHDVIWDNAQLSAAYLYESLSKYYSLENHRILKLATSIIKQSDQQIKGDPLDEDATLTSIMSDIDCSILGEPPEIFEEYECRIRDEYERIFGLDKYIPGRISFLQNLLRKPKLFHTSYFDKKYGSQAYKNIVLTINYLSKFLPAN